MKIIFVHIGREHLGIEYLSACLKAAGHEVDLAYDPGLFGPEDNVFCVPFLERIFAQKEAIINQIRSHPPDLVAFSVYTSTYAWCLSIAGALKKHIAVKTVFGGIHATLTPDTIIREPAVDFVIMGEGERPLCQLAQALTGQQKTFSIPGLWYKDQNEIKHNPVARPQKIDQLPWPDKALFEDYINFQDDYIIMTARGCVYHCSYCCETYLNDLYANRFYRRRTPASVIKELKVMRARYAFKRVMFNDALFFLEKDWLRAFLELYRLEIKLPFRCFGKFSAMDHETARLLKLSGCYCIEFGMQTLNENLKKNVLDRQETNQEALKSLTICDHYHLRYDLDHILGLPGESIEDHIQGARFYKQRIGLNRIKCHNLTYFPKMKINQSAFKAKILNQDDLKNISEGFISDFFHHDCIKDQDLHKAASNFRKLYKILPILPSELLEKIIKHHQWLAYIPTPLVILAQIITALKGRDHRFMIYLKYYPLKIQQGLHKLRNRSPK